MRQELEDKLVQAFPNFFHKFRGDPRETTFAFGFQCDDGWFDLLYRLCEDLKLVVPDTFRVSNVKEKFGILRFSTFGWGTSADEHDPQGKTILDLITRACADSATTCEKCGAKGARLTGKAWVQTLCTTCRP